MNYHYFRKMESPFLVHEKDSIFLEAPKMLMIDTKI